MSKTSSLEREMWGRGYASARVVAWKLDIHFTSVIRNVKSGKLQGEKVGHAWFVRRDSIPKYAGSGLSQLRGLHDWSDAERHFELGGQ